MPPTADDVAPNEWECKVFIAVANQGSYQAAANQLSAQIGRSYTRRAVNQVIKKIETWLKTAPFEGPPQQKKLTTRGEEFHQAALNIVADYQRMRNEAPPAGPPVLAALPHHVYLMVRTAELLPAPIPVRYLESRHTAFREFREHAVHHLHRDTYQLVVGPPLPDERTLVSKDLYSARLLAMVPKSYRAATVALTDLLGAFELFLPAEHSVPRVLLESRIEEWALDEAYKRATVAEAPHDTATAILRLRNEPSAANRAVIAPSDIAHVYTTGADFGGNGAGRFRWVPIVHEGATLESPVAVTTKKTSAGKLFPIISALRDAVAQLPAYAGSPTPRVPSPRRPRTQSPR